jgi:hypothetical protein
MTQIKATAARCCHPASMFENRARTGPEPSGLDSLARKFVAQYGAEARNEIISIIETLIADGDFEMARLWTRVTHASSRLAEQRSTPLRDCHDA